mmetsp:Transcript_60552/g.179470  ORF Transcript_60552/g.179470 Transcript_60552/m.179470 type:complete len:1620 (-) Transcript_60552:166-5025(-)|eukprot:CAMPEP_0113542012 /NCGR_PEP_ID=MMETSP0015_2-20120614/9364_1 /TAXON_ID=2838 /ORGANISM="Odontella" /LENGTH=1619 /DNA_ID=CAMNT_0000442009 /DNA_START=258 /DNA_END=5117 /DNA_ORIENTATION=- /assembly_acc=CAM_ASM_000160
MPLRAPSSPVPPTVADREAELAALQTAFDEYIASSRELEDELDAELTKMQEKLAESSAANAALASQLESVNPQLSSLERSLAGTKSELERERELRRRAELAQDESEGRMREAEGSLAALRHEHDEVMEGMAFNDEEVEELRLELEVEREEKERLREEVEDGKGDLEAALQRAERAEDELELAMGELEKAEKALEEATASRDERDGGQPEATSEEQAAEKAVAEAAAEEAEPEAAAPPLTADAPSPATARDDDGTLDDDLLSGCRGDDSARDVLSDSACAPVDEIETVPSGISEDLDASPATAKDKSGGDGDGVGADGEYVRELENELESVTEQLIAAETRAVDLEAALETARSEAEAAESKVATLEATVSELRETMSSGASEEREAVHRLMDELSMVKASSEKYREELELANEELGLVQEEMKAAEEDLTNANASMSASEERHLEVLAKLEKELSESAAQAREARTEADSLASALRNVGEEEQSLRDELAHLNTALDNARSDRDAAVEEMQALRGAFDAAEKAREEGVTEREEGIRRELMEAHQREVAELKEELDGLESANEGLKKMVEELESSRHDSVIEGEAASAAAAAIASGAEAAEKSEDAIRLEKELSKVRRDLERQEKEAERIKSDLESRVAKTGEELANAERELESARMQLADTTDRLKDLEANKERMRTPTKRELHKMESSFSMPDDSGVSTPRLFISTSFDEIEEEDEHEEGREGLPSTPSSDFHRSHARSRRRARHSSRCRARSSSPTTVIRLEKELEREVDKAKGLTTEVDKLKEQNRMAEAMVTHLEAESKKLREEGKKLRKEADSASAAAAIAVEDAAAAATPAKVAAAPAQPNAALSSFAPVTAAQYDLSDDRDDSEESDRPVEEVLASGDPALIESEYRSLEGRARSLREKNASLLQKVLSLQGNIQVYCRVRPLKSSEAESGLRGVVEPLGEAEVGCFDSRTKNWKSYNFDRVWGPESTQTGVFRDLEQLALSVVDGYNACIFAYGQTGSGKTFTMEGVSEGKQYGVSYRTIQKLFGLLHFRQQMQTHSADVDAPPFNFSLQVGMLEIYNDEVYDLLKAFPEGVKNPKKSPLDVRRGADGYVEVPGLVKEQVTSIKDVMDLLNRGTKNRASAATNLNEHSSRSHMILQVSVSNGLEGQQANKGNLYLVDLAGSERVRRSEVEGKELREAGFINKSLSALGNVMEALDRKAKHVPYRDSKLTYLLQDSLGGNSRTMMIVTVNPTSASYDETQFALQFATRVRRIQLGTAKRNVSSKNLEETVKNLTSKMKLLAKAKERSEQQMMSLKRENKRVQDRVKSASEARSKASDESRALAVLQKSNAEMAERWQKEKNLRDQKAADLENCKKELHHAQQQLQKSVRNQENLGKDISTKEQTISDLTSKLRAAKQEVIQAKQKVRKSQIVSPRSSTASSLKPSSSRVSAVGASRRNPPARNSGGGVDPPEMVAEANGPASGPAPIAENGDASEAVVDESIAETRAKVLELLGKHDPMKVDRIDTLMERFKGREQFLLDKISTRYEGGGGGDGGKDDDKPPAGAASGGRAGRSSSGGGGGGVGGGGPAAPMSAKKRSELALARHKERMQNRKSASGGGAAGGALLQSKLNG